MYDESGVKRTGLSPRKNTQREATIVIEKEHP
jgi:hypothetical protein